MGKIIRVALAEDHDLVRQGLTTLIQMEDDLSVSFEVANGKELMQKLKQVLPDILLLDIEMPLMNGMEALSKISVEYPDLKVIMLSMHDSVDFISDCVKLGAKGFLPKYCDFDKVAHSIRSVYNSGFYFDERITMSMMQELREKNTEIDEEIVLSDREVEIIKQVCKGLKNREIADELCLSKRTVENHRRRIMLKTDSKTTVDLVIFAIKNGVIEITDL